MNYNITIEAGCFNREISIIKPKLIIADRKVRLAAIDYPIEYVDVYESNKSFDFYFQLLDLLDKYKLNRNDHVVFVGGGVLIDVASFAACTYKRGVKYINVPTTTLSMIDSSVGSKNGLNYMGTKNLIGVISDPAQVIIDIDFLKTLDIRNYRNGLAEAIKIGYLSNPQIIECLTSENLNIERVIKLSVAEKLKYVNQDKQDHGYRNYLNFGHTFGHGIESITDFNRYLHGEAVSIGMVIASGYNSQLISILERFHLPTKLDLDINIDKLIEMMANDKKNTSNKTKIVLKNPDMQIVEMTNAEIKTLFNLQLEIPNQFTPRAITVNKSKSYIHRLLAITFVTKSKLSFEFDQLNDLSDDVIQSLNIIKQSAGLIEFANGQLTIDCRNIKKSSEPYYIYKSATTYRIFGPVLNSLFGPVDIKLDHQLAQRPHTPFVSYVNGDTHNIQFSAATYFIDGSVSSQFISGYIIALIGQRKSAEIIIENKITSAPYLDMTIELVNMFGYHVVRNDNIIYITDQRTSVVDDIKPELDFSSLAYFVVFNKLAQIQGISGEYQLPTFSGHSLQADSCIYNILNQDVVDLSSCPDLLPTLVVYGLLNKRGITLTNVDRIKYKECDRVQVMIDNFADLKAISLSEGSLTISPVAEISGRTIKTAGDHRIAMACAIIAPFCSGTIEIDDYTVVNKSFPTFFTQILGGPDGSIK